MNSKLKIGVILFFRNIPVILVNIAIFYVACIAIKIFNMKPESINYMLTLLVWSGGIVWILKYKTRELNKYRTIRISVLDHIIPLAGGIFLSLLTIIILLVAGIVASALLIDSDALEKGFDFYSGGFVRRGYVVLICLVMFIVFFLIMVIVSSMPLRAITYENYFQYFVDTDASEFDIMLCDDEGGGLILKNIISIFVAFIMGMILVVAISALLNLYFWSLLENISIIAYLEEKIKLRSNFYSFYFLYMLLFAVLFDLKMALQLRNDRRLE